MFTGFKTDLGHSNWIFENVGWEMKVDTGIKKAECSKLDARAVVPRDDLKTRVRSHRGRQNEKDDEPLM